jgi:lipopolysaccharide/colanic/teichoic acid biosynthesis glycosyltransferase
MIQPRGEAHPNFRRLFDAICAAAGLVLLAPAFAWLALWILWDDGPPVFFTQIRIGRNGKRFRIWKFRTMRTQIQGDLITAANDPRVTHAGTKLRRRKLDELPQLFNVLKGDMSLVGPRPEVPEYVQIESPIWQAILRERPGITDLASLLHRDEEKVLGEASDPDVRYRGHVLPTKLLLNLAYLESRSFWRDLKLVFLTVRYVCFQDRFDIAINCRRSKLNA